MGFFAGDSSHRKQSKRPLTDKQPEFGESSHGASEGGLDIPNDPIPSKGFDTMDFINFFDRYHPVDISRGPFVRDRAYAGSTDCWDV